jgi:hypothetical protein
MKMAIRMLVMTVVLASSSFGVALNSGFVGGGGPIPFPPKTASI